jgi:hypothetical protein
MEQERKQQQDQPEQEREASPSRRAFIKRFGRTAAAVPVAAALSLTTRKAWAY